MNQQAIQGFEIIKKKAFRAIILAGFFFSLAAGQGLCLEPLTEAQARSVVGAAGVSLGADNVILRVSSDTIRFTSVGNQNLFGTPISEGYFAINNASGLFTVNNMLATIDVGPYHRPNESYRVADIAKDGDDYKWMEPRNYVWGSSPATLSDTPVYWVIPTNGAIDPDFRPEPMDGKYGVIQASVNDLMDTFDLTANLGLYGGTGPETTLGTLGINGIHMPALTVGGTAMPGAHLTLYPDDKANINMEFRTRLSIDEISLKNASGAMDFKASGIHIGEAFFPAWSTNPLVSHKGGTGSSATVSGWSTTNTPWMYSGYFLFGNLNQLNFYDLKMESESVSGDTASFANGKQLYNRPNTDPEGSPYFYDHDTETLHTPVWIEPNPISINVAIRNSDHNVWNGYSYLSLTGGLHGSIRVASIQGHDGSELGPVAIDGLRVKYFKMEFPGGHQREFTTVVGGEAMTFGWWEKGRVLRAQETWLSSAEFNAAIPTPPTSTADGTLQWLLTPP